MEFLELFFTFFKLGLFTFGGGYAMIPLLTEEVLAHGWMTQAEILNFIAVAESTPGPIAVNMATFIGATRGEVILSGFVGKFLGSFVATLGVVLPSFIIYRYDRRRYADGKVFYAGASGYDALCRGP